MTAPTNADIANQLIASLPPGVFAHAALEAVQRLDYTLLEKMLPGVLFRVHKLDVDRWELAGRCTDGSTVVWMVGG